MILKNKTVQLLFIGVLVVCGGLYTSDAIAQGQSPAWQKSADIDLSAFRYVLEVPPHSYEVPTVLEVPIAVGSVLNKTAVAVGGQSTQPAQYISDTERLNTPVQVSLGHRPMEDARSLSDKKFETTVDFPFDETGTNKVSVTVTSSMPITTSELHLTLAPNVAYPHTIKISGGSKVLLAKTELKGSTVRFPKTTASIFVIEFELAQPLRLAEVEFVQESEVVRYESIRFLAQPNMNYTLYVDPDRRYGNLSSQGMSLASDEGVVTIGALALVMNKLYQPSDGDKDGVPDMYDNCVSVSNQDQVDIDKNGRGDACDDFDRDGVLTLKDNCPQMPNRDQRDTDGDGVGDACDDREDRLTERSPWVPWVGMGIAVAVLVGLLAVSVKTKPIVPVNTSGVAHKEEEENKVESL